VTQPLSDHEAVCRERTGRPAVFRRIYLPVLVVPDAAGRLVLLLVSEQFANHRPVLDQPIRLAIGPVD
jgi:hypothetical protein